jgi:hypothetical protein
VPYSAFSSVSHASLASSRLAWVLPLLTKWLPRLPPCLPCPSPVLLPTLRVLDIIIPAYLPCPAVARLPALRLASALAALAAAATAALAALPSQPRQLGLHRG